MTQVAEYKGYARDKRFHTKAKDDELEASTQIELEKKIDNYLKDTGLFPVEVFFISGGAIKHGRVTSFDVDSRRGWFLDDDGNREKPYNMGAYYLLTEKNKSIFESIQTVVAQRKILESQSRRLYDELSKLVSTLELNIPQYFKQNFKEENNVGSDTTN